MSFIPERLKELREARGYSYRDLANLCNSSKSSIHSYETGERNPKQQAIEDMARVLRCDVDYLTGRSDTPITIRPIEEVLGGLSEKELKLFNVIKNLPVDEFEKTIDELFEKLCIK